MLQIDSIPISKRLGAKIKLTVKFDLHVKFSQHFCSHCISVPEFLFCFLRCTSEWPVLKYIIIQGQLSR